MAAQDVIASTQVDGVLNASLEQTKLALLLDLQTGRFAADVCATSLAINGFATSADSARFQFNNLGIDFSTAPRLIGVDGVVGSLEMAIGSAESPLALVNVDDLNATLDGLLTIEGDFAFELQDGEVLAGVNRFSANFNDSISVNNGSGALLITAEGMAGSLSVTPSLNIAGVELSAEQVDLEFNTLTGSVNRTLDVGGETIALDLPFALSETSPYLSLVVTEHL